MGKSKPAAETKTKPPETNAHYIREAMKTLGEDGSTPKAVVAAVQQKYPQYEFSESSLSQGCSKMREELGYKPLRQRADGASKPHTSSSGEPTLADLMQAQDTLHTLGMNAGQLLKLVKELKSVGDLDTLEACLEAIEKIQAAKGK